MNFEKFGFVPTDIMIPKNIDMHKWSVVACDQYTSEPEYWEKTKQIAANEPSAYNIIFPEIYLESEDYEKKIQQINSEMEKYISDGVFETIGNSFVYSERTLNSGKMRRGLIGAVDLEKYDFEPNSSALIRATEGTVKERIPARVQIRENAPLEMPHVMLLVDDKDDLIFSAAEKGDKIYDFDLMQNGGHITGYAVSANTALYDAFLALYTKCDKTNPLMFAVGDGNHSLAAAKTCWEHLKKSLSAEEIENHPARYSLVEVVNIHDSSLEFEPIHRVVFGCDAQEVISDMKKHFDICENYIDGSQKVNVVSNGEIEQLYIKNPPSYLCVGTLQNYIDSALCGKRVDYIHGSEVVKKLANGNNIGFILPAMDKSDLFKTIIADGVLPRKTFSMGEACDKRYYLECRKIKKHQ